MPIPANHVNVNLIGTLPGGESFDTGFWMAGGAPTSAANANAYAAAVLALFNTYANVTGGPTRLIASDASYDRVKIYSYVAGGTQSDYVGEAVAPPYAGQGAGNPMPLQASLVVTLRTAFAGRSRRGRMYLPATALSLTAHQRTQADGDALVGVMADFFDACNADATLAGTVSVVSRTLTDSQPVIRIDVDSRVDVQRRRAAQQTELYNSIQVLA